MVHMFLYEIHTLQWEVNVYLCEVHILLWEVHIFLRGSYISMGGSSKENFSIFDEKLSLEKISFYNTIDTPLGTLGPSYQKLGLGP